MKTSTKANSWLILSIMLLTGYGQVAGSTAADNKTDEKIHELLFGNWKGNVNIQGTVLPVVFRFEKTDNGTRAFMDSPSQQAFNIPASALKVDGQNVTVEFSVIGLVFTGELNGKDILAGNLKQGEFGAQLVLTREKQ